MLLQLHVINAADKRRLMDIYAESNLENTDYFYPELTDKQEAVRRVERDFLNYLETAFLSSGENTLLIWEEQGIWVSALRLYRMREGFFYIEALETRPDFRRSGYAAKLLCETTEMLKKQARSGCVTTWTSRTKLHWPRTGSAAFLWYQRTDTTICRKKRMKAATAWSFSLPEYIF